MTLTNESKFFFSPSKEKYYLFVILILSFLIRLILALTIQSPIRSDSYDYQTLGLGILNGSYSLNGKPTAYVGPGYPLFLSVIYFLSGEGQFYVKLIQSVIDTFTCYFFYRVSRNFFNIEFSFLSLIIFSFFPSNIIYSQAVLSESLFGFFSMLILYFLLKNNFSKLRLLIFFTGILFGYSVLIRTSYMFAVIPVLIYIFYFNKNDLQADPKKKSYINVLIFLAGFLILLAPWCIRNKIQVGTFSPGTTAGVNFWAGSNPNSTGTYYNELGNNLPGIYNDESERDRHYFKLGLQYAVENPVRYLTLGIKKLGYLFSSERMAVLYFSEPKPGETSTELYKRSNLFFLLLVNIPYFIVMLTGTWGLIGLRKNKFLIYGFILTCMITIFLFVGLSRYHYALIPFFIIGAVNFISLRKNIFKNISLSKKITGVCFNVFLLSVWGFELYLLIK